MQGVTGEGCSLTWWSGDVWGSYNKLVLLLFYCRRNLIESKATQQALETENKHNSADLKARVQKDVFYKIIKYTASSSQGKKKTLKIQKCLNFLLLELSAFISPSGKRTKLFLLTFRSRKDSKLPICGGIVCISLQLTSYKARVKNELAVLRLPPLTGTSLLITICSILFRDWTKKKLFMSLNLIADVKHYSHFKYMGK